MTRSDLPEGLRDRLAFSKAEVARLAGVSATLIATEIRLGRLGARQVGEGSERLRWIIPLDSLLRWLNAEPAEAGR